MGPLQHLQQERGHEGALEVIRGRSVLLEAHQVVEAEVVVGTVRGGRRGQLRRLLQAMTQLGRGSNGK